MSLFKKPSELEITTTIKALIYGQPGMGKAQPLFSNVLTNEGFKPMGKIKVGDTVIGVDGKEQSVVGVFPQGKRPVYRVVTNDGAETLCDIEHIWTVRNFTGNSRKAGWRSMTLKSMIAKGILCPLSPSRLLSNRQPIPRFEIPLVSPVKYSEKEFSIDPYVLGVLIGDGSLVGSAVLFSNPDNDNYIKDEVSKRIPSEYILTKHESSCPQYCIAQREAKRGHSFRVYVDALGLCVHSGDKFIPEEYFYGSVSQRIDLLRGLMDTDGCCVEGCKVSFSTTSQKLASDVVELVRTLGGIATINYYEREDKDSDEYVVRIKINICPFGLERKAKNWHETTISRYIVSAEYVGEYECQCIKVSDERELYITDEYIVTHNTTMALSAPSPVLLDFDGGAQRVNGAFQVPTLQVHSWDEVIEAMKEDLSDFQTIVIDTAGKMLDFMAAYIIKNDSKLQKRDGSLSLQGYGVRKTMFVNFLKQCSVMGKNLIFVAHEREDKDNEQRIVRPEIGGSSAGDLIKELDLVGYMQAIGKDRTISWSPTEKFYAKNTCNLPHIMKVDDIIDANGMIIGQNVFMSNIIASYRGYLKTQRDVRAQYEALVKSLTESIEAVNDAKSANECVSLITTSVEHIWDSKVRTSILLNEKCKTLGLVFNKVTKKYEAAA